MEQALIQKLYTMLPEDRIRLREPLSRHTTFRIGGPAAVWIEAAAEEEMASVMQVAKASGCPCFVMGRGSNLLVSDEGYDGIILHMGPELQTVAREGNLVHAGAGASLSQIAGYLKTEGLSGFEFAAGIPGTLGGAVYMNAGAYGSEMKDVVRSVRAMKTDGEIVSLPVEALGFGYRTSRFQSEEMVVLSADMLFIEADPEQIQASMEDLKERRAAKQPLQMPSAGSVFKRPEGYYAGGLIEACGLKGFRIGGAEVSWKHAGFIVNAGDASSADVISLIRQIISTVYAQTGVTLEPELKLLRSDGLVPIEQA